MSGNDMLVSDVAAAARQKADAGRDACKYNAHVCTSSAASTFAAAGTLCPAHTARGSACQDEATTTNGRAMTWRGRREEGAEGFMQRCQEG
jgi:hypothetical protein